MPAEERVTRDDFDGAESHGGRSYRAGSGCVWERPVQIWGQREFVSPLPPVRTPKADLSLKIGKNGDFCSV